MTLTLHLLRALSAGLLVALAVLLVFCIAGYVTGVWLPGPAFLFSGWLGLIGALAHLAPGMEVGR